MGTNYIVKVFEIILLLCIVFHIIITVALAIENRMARPVRYAVAQKSKTHTGSKWMIYTGAIIFVFLVIHFVDFYFAKIGWVEGKYVAKVEKIDKAFQKKAQALQQGQMDEKQMQELQKQYMAIQSIPAEKRTEDFKYFVNLTKQDIKTYCGEDFEDYEPDFFNMARDKFHDPLYVLIYTLAFIVLAIHLYHGVVSVFQTYGLINEKYAKAIHYLALIYAIVVPLGFAMVPIHVILLF